MQRDQPYLILGVGELLWDIFPAPAGRAGVDLPGGSSTGLLGGAPANFTVMAGRLGNHAVLLSRVGDDDLGRRAIEMLGSLPVDASHLQVDPLHETGSVQVSLAGGQPAYTIREPAAWDLLEPSEEWLELAGRADAICFGSLAQRAPAARRTIRRLLARVAPAAIRILDVNLRAPFYSAEVIRESLTLATVVKMNDDELAPVLALAGLGAEVDPAPAALESGARRLLAALPALRLVAITCGGRGSLLVTGDRSHRHPGVPVRVEDTVGAGDAFTAALVTYLLRGADLPVLNEAGNRWGAWLASQPGAMPPMSERVREEIGAAIERAEPG